MTRDDYAQLKIQEKNKRARLAEAKEKAGNLNATFSLTSPDKKAIVIRDYGK